MSLRDAESRTGRHRGDLDRGPAQSRIRTGLESVLCHLASSPSERSPFPWRLWLLACLCAGAGGIAAESWLAVAALVPYAGAAPALWGLLRGRHVAVLLALYLVGPNPANDLLGQVHLDDPSLEGAATSAPFAIADLFLVVLLAGRLRADRRLDLPLPLLGWLTVVALLPLGAYASDPDQPLSAFLGQSALFLRGMLVLVLLCSLRRPPTELARDALAGLVVGGLWLAAAAVALWAAFGWQETVTLPWAADFLLVKHGRVSVPGWGNNILANVVAVAAVALLGASRGRRTAASFTVPFAVMVLATLATGTRAALVVVMLAALLVALGPVSRRLDAHISSRPPRQRAVARVTLATGACAVLTSGAFFLVALNPRLRSLEPVGATRLLLGRDYPTNLAEGSLFTRGSLYRGALRMFADSPVWGQGWGSWGWTRQSFGVAADTALDPHGGWFWALAEGGLVGLTLLLVPAAMLATGRMPRLLAAPVLAMLVLELANADLSKTLFSAVWWFLVGAALLAVASAGRLEARGPTGRRDG